MFLISKERWQKFWLNILMFNVPTFLLSVSLLVERGVGIKSAISGAMPTFLTAYIDLAKKCFEQELELRKDQ